MVDDANYWPGMGLITGFVLLFLIGLAVNAFIVRRVLGVGEELLMRVPVVKTVYSAIRDMTRLVNTDKKKGDLDRVVTLDFGFGKMIGFVTQEHANTLGHRRRRRPRRRLSADELPDRRLHHLPAAQPRQRNGIVGRAGHAHRAHGRRARQVNGDIPHFLVKSMTPAIRSQTWRLLQGNEECPHLPAGLLHVGVTELLEFFDQPVAMIPLDLDDAVLDGAAGAAFFLECAADFFELRPGSGMPFMALTPLPPRCAVSFQMRMAGGLAGAPGFMKFIGETVASQAANVGSIPITWS